MPTPVNCVQAVDCGYFDAGCGVAVFCGRCAAPQECGVSTPNRCADPRVCTPEGWCWEHPLPQGGSFVSGFAFGPREVYLGTDTGSLLFWNGERTRGTTFPTQAGVGVRAVFGVSSTELYVGTEGGRIFRFDGTTWSRELISTGVANAILSIHRGPSGVIVAAGSGGVLLERNPTTQVWTPISISPPTTPAFRRVFVAEPFIFAISDLGQVYRGAIGSNQVLAVGPLPPISLITERNAAAFSADAGFVVVAGGAVAPASGRAVMLDLRQPTGWVTVRDEPGQPFEAVEIQEPRVFLSGNRGNVAVVTLAADGGVSSEGPLLPSDAPLFRSVIPTATDQFILGGNNGVMGFVERDGGAWSVTDNAFAQNRFDTNNDGCATAGLVAGSPVAFVTSAGNRIGSRGARWSWQGGGSVGGSFEWGRCHVTAQDQAWAVGNDRALVNPVSRVARRSGQNWTEVDTPQFSQQWAAVSGFPGGSTFFLANSNVVLVNVDGGTTPGAFRRVVLDGGPVNDLFALSPAAVSAVHGAMNRGNHFSAEPQFTAWNWSAAAQPPAPPNDAFAIHGVGQGNAFFILTVGSAGLVIERNQSLMGVQSRVPGVSDLTDVWVSSSRNAYIATTVDAGTLVGRTSPTVIFRSPDGGVRLEPVPVSQRIRGLFGVDDLDGTTRVWVTGSSGAVLRRDLPDGG